jgi:tetratricopeptide (TPR) repeat protein
VESYKQRLSELEHNIEALKEELVHAQPAAPLAKENAPAPVPGGQKKGSQSLAPQTDEKQISRGTVWAAAAVIIGLGCAAYANSFSGKFLQDDIEGEPFGNVRYYLTGFYVAGRRLLCQLSISINGYLGDANPWGFHLFNLIVHLVAALALFGVVRRTLQSPRLKNRFERGAVPVALSVVLIFLLHPLQTESVTYICQRAQSMMGLFIFLALYCVIRAQGTPSPWALRFFAWCRNSPRTLLAALLAALALAVAFCLKVHPHADHIPLLVLILCYAFYCKWHTTSSGAEDWRWWSFAWHVGAVFAGIFGLDVKPHLIGLPLLLLLYERIFWRRSWREVFQRSLFLYVLLAFVWIYNVGSMVNAFGSKFAPDIGQYGPSQEEQFASMTSWQYGRSQFEAIMYYLRLFVWPHPLCLDSLWPVASSIKEWLPYAIPVLALVALTVWALLRKPAWGYLGAWFFVNLAPSSSFVPRPDIEVEHRMYVPLVALAALLVCAAYLGLGPLLGRIKALAAPERRVFLGGVVMAAVVAALGALTWQRNAVYQDPIAMYEDILRQSPNNPRAHSNLGLYLCKKDRLPEAEAHCLKALSLNKNYWQAMFNLGMVYEKKGKIDEAIKLYEQTLKYNCTPDYKVRLTDTCNARGLALLDKENLDEAEADFREILRWMPDCWKAYNNLGLVFKRRGMYSEAVKEFKTALRLNPNELAKKNLAEADILWGRELQKMGQLAEAETRFAEARENAPDSPELTDDLSKLRKKLLEQFKQQMEEAKDLEKKVEDGEGDPIAAANACNLLGLAMRDKGLLIDAVAQFQEALHISPTYWAAHYNLGLVCRSLEKYNESKEHFEEVLRLEVDEKWRDETRHRLATLLNMNIGNPMLEEAKFADAEPIFRHACELVPDYWQAHFGQGVALFKLGRMAEAREAFNVVLHLNPGNFEAKDYLEKISGLKK